MSRIQTPVSPTLQRRALWHPTTVRAWGVQDVTTRATLRPQRAQAPSVYHVRVLRDGDAPTSFVKIQGSAVPSAGPTSHAPPTSADTHSGSGGHGPRTPHGEVASALHRMHMGRRGRHSLPGTGLPATRLGRESAYRDPP